MIYVFEGIEGAGKSSTAAAFAARSGLGVFDDPERHTARAHARTPADWMKLGTQANADIAAMARLADFVVDRWCLSSMTLDYLRGVYIGDEFYRRLAERTPAKVVLLDADPAEALERAKDVGERGLTLDLLKERRDRYCDALDLWRSWGGDASIVSGRDEALLLLADEVPMNGIEFAKVYRHQYAFNQRFFETLGLALADLSTEERERWTKEFVIHIGDELHEFLRETRWKMHKRGEDRPVVRANLLEEWVDVLKFLLGLANLWGFDASEIVREYYRKSAVVEERLRRSGE